MTTCLRLCDMNAIGDAANPWSAPTFDIAIHNRYKDRRYLLGSSNVSVPYRVQFYVNVGTMIIKLRLQISQPK